MLSKMQLEVATLASGEQSRYTLNGILVTPNETVETDGHQLVRVGATAIDPESFPPVAGFTPTKDFKPFLLPKDAALTIAKALPRKQTIPVLECAAIGSETDTNGFAVLAVTDLERAQVFRPKKLEGQFPDWHRVMPDKDNAKVVVEFNAALLLRVLSFIVKAVGYRDMAAVTFRFYENGGPCRIDTHEADIQAVVMPLKADTAKIEDLPAPVYFEADTAQHVTILGMIGKVVTLLAGQFSKPYSREVIEKLGAFITDLAKRATVIQKEVVQ